jgi:DNA alkylation repair enzyme
VTPAPQPSLPNAADTFEACLRTHRIVGVNGQPQVAARHVFAVAKTLIDMAPVQIEELLGSPDHDHRVGAVSIMDFQARRNRTLDTRRTELYDLYVRRHDLINNWDLVDRAAPSVIGRYLTDKPRTQLYTFAASSSQWERRTAIVATYHFIRNNDLDDTFAIAELLINDHETLVQKAVGGWIREAGKRNPARLRAFLDHHAATMPRTTLRYAIEHFAAPDKQHFMNVARTTSNLAKPAKGTT